MSESVTERNARITDYMHRRTAARIAAGRDACWLHLRGILYVSWNYRWIAHEHKSADGFVDKWLGLHEVYYDSEGNPEKWSEEAAPILVDDRSEIAWMMTVIEAATAKSVLQIAMGPDGKKYLIEQEM